MASAPSSELIPTPNPSNLTFTVATVAVALTVFLPAAQGKTPTGKPAKAKLKTDTKNKQFSYDFDNTKDNYISFLNQILAAHGLATKYGPVTSSSRFPIKILTPPARAKADAVDVERHSEYKDLIDNAREKKVNKLTVLVHINAIKDASKKRKAGGSGSESDSGSDGQEIDEGSGEDEKGYTAMDRELGRLRGLLEKKYQNPNDSGYTYITNDGERLPLTPIMLAQWCRALYDNTVTLSDPPNCQAFDMANRGRLLPGRSPTSNSSSSSTNSPSDSLGHVASIFSTLTTLLGAKNLPSPILRPPTPSPASPAQNTPTKLTRFLHHAQDNLGIPNALECEGQLSHCRYGPDIIPYVSDTAIAKCGFTEGDVIRLKRGAEAWWASPEAKRKRARIASPSRDITHAIRFEKRFVEGGSASYFGSGMEMGYNGRSDEYEWWYYCDKVKELVKVPAGQVPVLAAEYSDAREGEDDF